MEESQDANADARRMMMMIRDLVYGYGYQIFLENSATSSSGG